jgi:hypothetical protein
MLPTSQIAASWDDVNRVARFDYGGAHYVIANTHDSNGNWTAAQSGAAPVADRSTIPPDFGVTGTGWQ